MNPWEKGTPLDRLVRKQERADKGITFQERAERYRQGAERIVHAEKLATLARGFVTGCGGVVNVKADDCERFVKDHSNVVKKAMDTVPEEDLSAAVYALVVALESH